MGRAFLKQIALRAQTGFQRHHHCLAQRVNRWISDLGELLAKVVIQRTGPSRQYRKRGVVTHRANGLLPGFGQRPQHLIALLKGHAE